MSGKRVRPNTIYPLSAIISVITLIDFKQVEENLNSSIISDVLDGMGVRGQAMGTEIRPMDDDMVLIGYAATMLMTDQYDYEKDTSPSSSRPSTPSRRARS